MDDLHPGGREQGDIDGPATTWSIESASTVRAMGRAGVRMNLNAA